MTNHTGITDMARGLLSEAGADGITIRDLAEASGVALKGMQDAITKLRAMGEVEVVPEENQSRARRYRLATEDAPAPKKNPKETKFPEVLSEPISPSTPKKARRKPAAKPSKEIEPGRGSLVNRLRIEQQVIRSELDAYLAKSEDRKLRNMISAIGDLDAAIQSLTMLEAA
jgi:DNA-binding transcriptional MocR family regulator